MFCRNNFGIYREDSFGYFAVYFMIVVFIMDVSKDLFQLFERLIDERVVLFFQSLFQVIHNHVRATEFNGATECFHQVVILTGHRHCLVYNGIYFFYYTFVLRFTFSEFCEFLLLFCLCTQYIIINDRFIHTDGVLPVIAAAGILVGILNTSFVAGSHHFFQYGEACATYSDTRLVLCFHTFLYFRYGEVTACASGETHDHGVITFFQSLDRNRQIFGSLQRYI